MDEKFLKHTIQALIVTNALKEKSSTSVISRQSRLSMFFYLTIILLQCIQQLCGYYLTGQLQEPKNLSRPATAKAVFAIL